LQNLNSQYYLVGAALMLNGAFMIYSINHGNFLTKGLFAATNKGLSGQRISYSYIPKKQRYYHITTSLGK
jgi:hypothetical protein